MRFDSVPTQLMVQPMIALFMPHGQEAYPTHVCTAKHFGKLLHLGTTSWFSGPGLSLSTVVFFSQYWDPSLLHPMPTPLSLGQVPESWQDLNRDLNCQKLPLLCYLHSSVAVFLARSLFALFCGLRFVDLPLSLSLFLSLIHTLSCFSTVASFSLSRVLSLCELCRFSLLCLFFFGVEL